MIQPEAYLSRRAIHLISILNSNDTISIRNAPLMIKSFLSSSKYDHTTYSYISINLIINSDPSGENDGFDDTELEALITLNVRILRYNMSGYNLSKMISKCNLDFEGEMDLVILLSPNIMILESFTYIWIKQSPAVVYIPQRGTQYCGCKLSIMNKAAYEKISLSPEYQTIESICEHLFSNSPDALLFDGIQFKYCLLYTSPSPRD